MELEDDFIFVGKWKKELHNNKALPTTSFDPMIQILSNDIISLKRQMLKGNQLYQDIPRKDNFQQGIKH